MKDQIKQALDQIEAMAGEPVAWQRRMRPTWGNGKAPWGPWEECSEGQAKDCWRTPLLHDWAYEARALYTAPVAQQPNDHVAVTWDKDRTRILAVTLQDAEGRVLCVIDEAPAQQPQAVESQKPANPALNAYCVSGVRVEQPQAEAVPPDY